MCRSRRTLARQAWLLLAMTLVLSACRLPFQGGTTGASSPAASAPSINGQGTPASQTQPAGVQATQTPAPGAASQIVEGGTAEPRTLNPILTADPISDELSHLVFNGLVYVDPVSGQAKGDLAKSWDVSNDRKSYTFHLNSNVIWQDGQPFSAQDVVFTYKLMMNDRARSPRYSELVESVSDVQAPDLRTVTVTLTHPDAAFLTTSATYGIVPQHVLSGVLPEELVSDPFGVISTIGTGPFTLATWSHGDRLVFTRNPTYFRGKAAYGQYVYKVVSSAQELVDGLAQGSIDWGVLDPPLVANAQQNKAIKVVSLPGDDLEYVALQLDSSKQQLFLDANVRQALMLALDRNQLLRDVWKDQGKVATGTIPPSSWAAGDSTVSYAQDLDKARELLQQSGWVTGDDGIRSKNNQRLQFKLLTNGDDPQRRETANWLIQSWRAIGIDAVPDFEKWSTIVQDITHDREFDAVLLGYEGEADPDQSMLWSSDSFFDGFNLGHYSNPDVDSLLVEARQSGDPAARKSDYAKVQDQVLTDLPALPLVFPAQVVGLSPRLRDVNVTTILIRNRANIDQWHPGSSG